VICGIEAAVENYGGTIDELIYIYFENDFRPGWAYGEPEEVVAWLEEFAARHGIQKVSVVYASFIYNIIPQLTRFKGHPTYRRPNHYAEKRRLADAVANAKFDFIDFADIAQEENRKQGTMFAAFALYVDHSHFSRLGILKLVERLRNSKGKS